MAVAVCSGWHPAGFALYGADFIVRFDRYWPDNVRLTVYVEEMKGLAAGAWNRRVTERTIERCIGARDFIERHKLVPAHCGREQLPSWKPKDRTVGYSWRYDAVRFCKQLFIPENVADDLEDGDVLAWLDADVMTFASVPKRFLEETVGDADLVHLGRGEKHSEIGFWAVRVNAKTRAFLRGLADMYRTDAVFSLKEWHSAYVFDHCRKASGLKVVDLTPGGRAHVWFYRSPLNEKLGGGVGEFSDHCKGDRKGRGSPECPVQWWKE